MINKYFKPFRGLTLLIISAMIIFTSACEKRPSENPEIIEKEVKSVVSDFYKKYADEDIAFVDYYAEDVIRMGTDGQYTVGVEEFRNRWQQTIDEDAFDLLSYGEPKLVLSREQVVSFNTYDEIFIDHETQDTTRYTGTWLAVWQKQPEDNWKIVLTTWHSN